MQSIRVKCSECGYEGQRLENELEMNECPICNTKGSLQINQRDKEVLIEQEILNHILKGFKLFGIECTIEYIDRSMKGLQRSKYKEVVLKYFKGLKICFTKQ